VREALARVLTSHEFRASRRCQDFLTYVVNTTLAGKSDSLKERTIGIDVFGRSYSYDPSDDATVRVKAGEVRKRLGLYYASEGREDPVRIDLPAGTYVPEFRPVVREAKPVPIAAPTTNEQTSAPAKPRFIWGAVALTVALGGILLFYILRTQRPAHTALDAFWGPVLEQSSTPVVLSVAYVPVYAISHPPTPENPAKVEDFTLLTDQFIGGGDLLAISRLSAMLHDMHRAYQVKLGTEGSFSDLRASPTIVIGYSYTRWKDISKAMRFFIDADRRPLMVLDNGKPTNWALPNLPADKRTDEDFAIVTRVFHPDTRTMLVEVAGITQYGTSAAAELVTNADLLGDALKTAPPDWQKKNLQLVLHTKVISGMAASPRVLTAYFW
jgi:hypothetical protein